MRIKPRSPVYPGDNAVFTSVESSTANIDSITLTNPLAINYGGTNSKTVNSAQSNLSIPDISHIHNTGIIGDITISLVGNVINVGSCQTFIFNNSTYIGVPELFTITENSFTIPLNTTKYIVINYNSGNPIYQMVSDSYDINESNVIPAVTVMNDDNELHYRSYAYWGTGELNKHNQRLIYTRRFLRESGFSISEEANRVIIVSAGRVWYGITRYTLPEIKSSTSRLYYWYHDETGTWINNDSDTFYDNLHYDNATSGLKDLDVDKYTVNWIYRLISDDEESDEIMYIQSCSQYDTLGDASDATIPAAPEMLSSHCLLVGRIIVKKGDVVASLIESAFDTTFTGSQISDHNSLTNLQGGKASEYYHLEHTQHDVLTDGSDADSLHTHNLKADKVVGATNGHFASLDALGNLGDSGHKDSDYADAIHTHDDRYYTESENDILLAGKSSTAHLHDDRYYTESETNSLLNNKLNIVQNTIRVSPVGGDYQTLNECITYLNSLTSTDGIRVVVDGGTYDIASTITINATMPISIEGSGISNSILNTAAGLLNNNMFEVLSQTHFDKLTFQGTDAWVAGTNASFIRINNNNLYCEIKDFIMDKCKKGIEVIKDSEIFAFDFIISNATVSGIEINTAGACSIDTEIGNLENCQIGINLLQSSLANVFIDTLRFINGLDNTSIIYTPANFTYYTFTIGSCEWNNIGTFLSGFDFTNSRDANIEIINCIGIESKSPFAKINLVGNTTVTTLNQNVWTKAVYTNTSIYDCKFTIANNKITFQPDHSRDLIMYISGSIYISSNGTREIKYSIVKNGDSSSVYGLGTVTVDQNSRKFTFTTNVYLESVAKNDYFEIWIMNITNGDDPTISDLTWTTISR